MKKILAIVLALSMVFALCATSAVAADDKIKVGFVISDLSDAIFAELVSAIEEYAETKDNVSFVAKEATELPDKITAIENFVSGGYDCIICHVTDAEALKDAALAAEAQGVYFISYDTAIDGTSAWIGLDNFDYGYAIAKNAAEWINENFATDEEVKVAVCNYPDYPFLVTREEGILAALEEISPNAKVVASAKAGYTPEGVEVGEAWSQSIPDVNVVVGINDAGVLGVYEVFNGAGINGEKLGMFGGDATGDAIAAIKDGGTFKATVSTSLVKMAPQFLDLAVELVETEGNPAARELLFPMDAITAENVNEY